MLTDLCSFCSGTALITAFGGSPLSGSNSWGAVCKNCKQRTTGHSDGHKFGDRMTYASRVRKQFPQTISEWCQVDGHQFDWAKGLKPVRKKQLVAKQLAEPMTPSELIADLKTGELAESSPPESRAIDDQLQLKFSKTSGEGRKGGRE
jgi:hypothetical protein